MPGLVGLNDQATAALAQNQQPIPRPVSVRALIDTGTDATAIAGHVVRALGLGVVRRAKTHTAAGPVHVPVYRVSLSVIGPPGAVPPLLVWPDLFVTELAVTIPDVDVLIGLDVLRQTLFILNGPADQFILGK